MSVHKSRFIHDATPTEGLVTVIAAKPKASHTITSVGNIVRTRCSDLRDETRIFVEWSRFGKGLPYRHSRPDMETA